MRVLGLGAFLLQRYRLRRDRMMAEVQRLRLREFGQALAYSGITALVLAGAFSYTALQASAGHLQRSEEHTSELQSHLNLVCRLLLEKKKNYFVISFVDTLVLLSSWSIFCSSVNT